MTGKIFNGRFFEDFEPGVEIRHPGGRTLGAADGAYYLALSGDRRPLHLNTDYARSCGWPDTPIHDLLTFNLVFGQSVMDISFNAIANLGYAGVRFLAPVFPGDTLRAASRVLGRRPTSDARAGIVWVRTQGTNQRQQPVLEFCRWVLVARRDPEADVPAPAVPDLDTVLTLNDLLPPALGRVAFDPAETGGGALFDDYAVGERLMHPGGMTIEAADHMTATRWYQNTARPHFESLADAPRLVYGGHVISVAYALAFNGLQNGLAMAGWNGGTHAHPTHAGDCLYAVSEVLAAERSSARADLGALRLRLLAFKNEVPDPARWITAANGGRPKYHPNLVLDLDYWLWIPR